MNGEGKLTSFPAVPGWEEDDRISEDVLLRLRELGIQEGGVDGDCLVDHENSGPTNVGGNLGYFLILRKKI